MIGDMQTTKTFQFMSLGHSNLRIQCYAFDFFGGLFFENRIFPGQCSHNYLNLAHQAHACP